MNIERNYITAIPNGGAESSLKNISSYVHTPQAPLHHSTADKPSDIVGGVFLFKIRSKMLTHLSHQQVKALSLLALVRMHEASHPHNDKHYSIADLKAISHLHKDTLGIYVNLLILMKLAKYDKVADTFTFGKTRASHKLNNTIVPIQQDSNAKTISKLILSARLQVKLRQMLYVKNVLDIAQGVVQTTLKQFKRAVRWSREHLKYGTDFLFTDNGWTYDAIAEYLGVSRRTAVRIIQFAVENKLIEKHNHGRYHKVFNKHEYQHPYYNFVYRHSNGTLFMYRQFPNSYTLVEDNINININNININKKNILPTACQSLSPVVV